MQKLMLLVCLLLISIPALSKIKAEAVLGEYWKDPLFGEAAAARTIKVEVLHGKIWPNTISVKHSQIIRFVFDNKSKETHLFAFANDIDALSKDADFQLFVADELFHSQDMAHSGLHSHGSSSVDDAEAIVKLLTQQPTVLIKPNDIKEILIRFDAPSVVELRCVINEHLHQTMQELRGTIRVLNHE